MFGCRERSSQPCQRFNKGLPNKHVVSQWYRLFGRSHLGHSIPSVKIWQRIGKFNPISVILEKQRRHQLLCSANSGSLNISTIVMCYRVNFYCAKDLKELDLKANAQGLETFPGDLDHLWSWTHVWPPFSDLSPMPRGYGVSKNIRYTKIAITAAII